MFETSKPVMHHYFWAIYEVLKICFDKIMKKQGICGQDSGNSRESFNFFGPFKENPKIDSAVSSLVFQKRLSHLLSPYMDANLKKHH